MELVKDYNIVTKLKNKKRHLNSVFCSCFHCVKNIRFKAGQ